jgi:hypothetical protein
MSTPAQIIETSEAIGMGIAGVLMRSRADRAVVLQDRMTARLAAAIIQGRRAARAQADATAWDLEHRRRLIAMRARAGR